MKKILLAFQFLTIIPVKVKGDISEKEIARSANFFSFVGAFQGLIAASAGLFLIKVFSPEITGALIVFILILSNGGFHLDGLADTVDALAVKSSGDEKADRERRLAVMKDSSTGAIGVVSITLTILMKYLFIKDLFLINAPLPAVLSILFLMPVFSKWAMVPAMYHGISARRDGLGRIFIDNSSVNNVIFSSAAAIIFYILIAVLYPGKSYGSAVIVLFFVLFFVLYAFSFFSAKFCERKFGGLTGDTLGAIGEISEILFLMVALIWLQHSI